MKVLVQSAGFLSSVQDLGRGGFRQSGVSVGGALDPHALRVANALVDNDDNAAGLEATLGNVRLHFEDERTVAWCGGEFSVRVGGEDLPAGRAATVSETVELIMIARQPGGRAWLAISGGIDVPLVLGSRSTDRKGNFGGHEGRALRDGDVLPLFKERRPRDRRPMKNGGLESAAPSISEWGAPAVWASIVPASAVLRVVRGTDWNRFSSAAREALVSSVFTVTADSDRMGARLEGSPVHRVDSDDLLSEAVVPGTLQVPPNGSPILLLGDCQTIGGYPKIAHVITVDLPIAAQLCPADTVRFNEIPLAQAQDLLREREEDFARFRVGLSLHFS
jgi:antagonist of KipI